MSTFRNPNIIPTKILFYMAWKNMVHKKLRAVLTVMGVVIGIGAIFFHRVFYGPKLPQPEPPEVVAGPRDEIEAGRREAP